MRIRIALLLCLSMATVAHAQAIVREAVPLPAIPAILDLFKHYQMVGLGEGPHGNKEGHLFRLALVRDPRFPSLVNDILVESGSARYQAEMDRYIAGEAVPRQQLRRAWEDTTNPGTNWDKPMYEEFFTAVRNVNATLPAERKLRVLLGDPPIAWESIRSRADLRRWNMQRDAHAGAVLRRESFAKGRKVLAIYGDGHFQGRGFKPASLTNIVEREKVKLFTISTRYGDLIKLQPSVASWKTPATMTLIPPGLCRDADYMKMRLARLAITSARTNSSDPAGSLRKLCADLTGPR